MRPSEVVAVVAAVAETKPIDAGFTTQLHALCLTSGNGDLDTGARIRARALLELADETAVMDALANVYALSDVDDPHRQAATTVALAKLDRDCAAADARDEQDAVADAGEESHAARVLTLDEFLRVEFPQREQMLAPIFPRQGLGMIHAWRGLGKTYLALAIALAVACGTRLLKWNVSRPWRVLFVDGEMPGALLQERLAKLVRAMPAGLDPAFFRIITPDVQAHGIPDLGTLSGQRWLDSIVGDAEVLLLDNLSSLVRSGSENADELWLPMATWLLRHRAAGRAAWMVHHDGKGENQRGISKREDLLDTVMQLRKPPDYQESDGARFTVTYPKHRDFHGADAEPFEARLVEDESGGLVWTVTEVDDARTRQVADMLTDGRTVTEIVKALNIGRATVDRHKRKAIAQGIYHE